MSKSYYRDVRDYPNLEIKNLRAGHECFGATGGVLDFDLTGIPAVFCPKCCAHAEVEDSVCQHCDEKVSDGTGS